MIRWLGRTLVALQILLAAILVSSGASSMFRDISAWGAVALCGVALHVWAVATMGPGRVQMSPTTPRHGELITGGPYRFIRHPMYTALLIFCLGFIGSDYAHWKTFIWMGLALVLAWKSQLEERALKSDLAGYAEYAQATWRFAPYLW